VKQILYREPRGEFRPKPLCSLRTKKPGGPTQEESAPNRPVAVDFEEVVGGQWTVIRGWTVYNPLTSGVSGLGRASCQWSATAVHRPLATDHRPLLIDHHGPRM
jgi:hypothetical protein